MPPATSKLEPHRSFVRVDERSKARQVGGTRLADSRYHARRPIAYLAPLRLFWNTPNSGSVSAFTWLRFSLDWAAFAIHEGPSRVAFDVHYASGRPFDSRPVRSPKNLRRANGGR